MLAVNRAMVDLLGYPDAESLLSAGAGSLYVDPEDNEGFRRLVGEGDIIRFEARLRRRDGSVMWSRHSARAVRDEDGDIMYVEGALADVTEEKLSEERLRRQAHELAALHDTTLGLIEQLDVTSLLDAILSRAADLLGTEHAYLYVVDGDELVVRAGTGLFVDYVGYRLKRGEGLAGRVWASGQPYAVDDYLAWEQRRPEFTFIRAAAAIPLRAGSEVVGVIGLVHTEEDRPFAAREMGLISRFGHMASLVLTNARLYDAAQREIAERRRIEAELRQSEHRYRALIEATSEWIWSCDLEGRHTSSNPAVRDILGYEPEEMVGRPAMDFMHPEDRQEVEEWFPSAIAQRRGWANVLIRWRHKDGTYRWLESTGTPVLDDDGGMIGYWGADRDVTERVRAEEERRRLLAELVRIQEQERHRIATEIHDDPVQAMTAVGMRLESLRRRMESDEERQALDDLASAVTATIGRLRHLLVGLRPPRLDREGLASALRALLDRLHEETGVEVHLDDRSLHDIPPDTRTVLYRIAQEALSNVRKHSRAREVRILVAEREEGILMRVRDDGRGFDPVRREDGDPGHIGLVSMRERAELAGGSFRITSAPGGGTTMDVMVPVEADGD